MSDSNTGYTYDKTDTPGSQVTIVTPGGNTQQGIVGGNGEVYVGDKVYQPERK